MEKQTITEIVAYYKGSSLSTVRAAIRDIEEQLTWTESEHFPPVYSKEEKRQVIAGLLILEKVKYEEEQKEWFWHFSK